MRCPDCQKMVSYDEPQLELQDEDISGGEFSCNVRIILPCAECGGELKECTLEFQQTIEHECDEDKVICSMCEHPKAEHPREDCDVFEEIEPEDDKTYELEMNDPEPTEDYRPKTKKLKNGTEKPVPFRYQKHYFGASISGTATCNRCREAIEIADSQDEQSSSFEDLT